MRTQRPLPADVTRLCPGRRGQGLCRQASGASPSPPIQLEHLSRPVSRPLRMPHERRPVAAAPVASLPRPSRPRRAWRNSVCAAGPRWSPHGGVLGHPHTSVRYATSHAPSNIGQRGAAEVGCAARQHVRDEWRLLNSRSLFAESGSPASLTNRREGTGCAATHHTRRALGHLRSGGRASVSLAER